MMEKKNNFKIDWDITLDVRFVQTFKLFHNIVIYQVHIWEQHKSENSQEYFQGENVRMVKQ